MAGRWLIAGAVIVLAGACADRSAPGGVGETNASPDVQESNRLRNASFEGEEASPWFDFAQRNPKQWGPMAISDERAREGERSALLVLDSGASGEAVRVLGVAQEIRGGGCPAYVSGWYFVEDWSRGCEAQYLQVVAIALGGEAPEGLPNYQVARTLAGVTRAPFRILNRRFEIGGPPEPEVGRWVFFEVDLAAMFERRWGMVPDEGSTIRLFFEARYDGRDAERDPPARARVYFDDLYAGSESRAGALPDPADASEVGDGEG